MGQYLIMLLKIFHLLIIQSPLLIVFVVLIITPYIVCSPPINSIQNNFLHSNSKTVKLKPN